jgi:hypothetical protein
MRDLKPGDRMTKSQHGYSIIDEHGTIIPMCWENLKDWARWWFRQAEMNADINIPADMRALFTEILNR